MEGNIETKRPPYAIITILMIGAFISMLNETLLNVALPSIMKDLDIQASTAQWLTNGYMLVNGVLVPITAFLIQRYSVRGLFLTAMGLFTIGTVTAGFSHVFAILLIARMVQAAGSAIMMPLLMNVMLTSFPPEKRGGAMGLFGLVFIFAPAIGPTLSGYLVEHHSWRILFHLVTPIAAAIFIIAIFLLKDKKEKIEIRLDILSIILSSLAFGGLLYGFSSAGTKGWSDLEVYGTIVIGAICLILFIWRQSKLEKPMLNFGVYRFPMFALSSAISIVISMAMFSAMLLMPIYLQTLRGISPLKSGLLMLPGSLLMGIMSPIMGKLFDKFGGRVLAVIGLAITTLTSFMFSRLTLDTSYTELILIYSARMFGMSMVMMPVMTNGMNQLPARFYPHGTAMNNTLQQVSGAIGSAILVSIMSSRTKAHATDLMSSAMKHLTSQPTAPQIAAMKQQITMKATLEGINDSFLVSVGIACVALILAFFIKRVKPAADPMAAPTKDPIPPLEKISEGN
ncbi:DHA2 family efflux MFS transporter permease subunit [Pullulanibacillus sp. KACC 23026]|uniref:DHA2 family efflux MFS transporter permease subunit n=1 Tax=Pullulanibacillus sp. KACC 23026 TaxID=3028315 RepID=UPI0023AFA406|nr:DHA2 family efflux MFS transporter permease subunit [Pullulanibacillus sp. KACC 23026]WEG14563.1 DHA2 family efflux MFS transporter permease subunit [Pullulanibacillus sp. KACC 23026]